jgi:hypothetical protein
MVGFGEARRRRFRDHRLGRRIERDEQADHRLFALDDAFQLVDLIDRDAAAFDFDDRLVGLALGRPQIDHAVNAGIRALLAAAKRLGVRDERDRPFFELVLVAQGEVSSNSLGTQCLADLKLSQKPKTHGATLSPSVSSMSAGNSRTLAFVICQR